MRYHDPSPTRPPPHLIVEVVGTAAPLADEPIRRVDRRTDHWHCSMGEVWTPMSIPLTVTVTLGVRNGVQVRSAGVLMLDVASTDMGLDVSLRLPTDEVLRLWIAER